MHLRPQRGHFRTPSKHLIQADFTQEQKIGSVVLIVLLSGRSAVSTKQSNKTQSDHTMAVTKEVYRDKKCRTKSVWVLRKMLSEYLLYALRTE